MPAPAKPLYLSRTLLVALLAIVAAVVQWRLGWVVPPEAQLALVGLVVGVLRTVTDRPVVLRQDRVDVAIPPAIPVPPAKPPEPERKP